MAQIIPADTLTVKNIAQEQGLSQLGAAALAMDDNGYVWIATENGLNRFNGYEMKVFRAGDKPGELPDDDVTDLFYKSDTLWIATTTHSLVAYILSEDRFLSFEDQIDFEAYPLVRYSSVLYAVDERYLLVGAIGNCLLVDRKTLEFTVIPIPKSKENDYVTAIQEIGDDTFLIGTNFSGIYKLDLRQKSVGIEKVFNRFKESKINCFYPFSDTETLIGTDGGLFVYYCEQNTVERIGHPPDFDTAVRSIVKWDDNTLLVGGFLNTYLLDHRLQWRKMIFVEDDGKQLQSGVLCVAKDNQDGLWIGTQERGILYYHPKREKFIPYRIKAPGSPKKDFISIFSFLRDGNTIWMATELGWVRYRPKKDDYKLYMTNCFLEYVIQKDFKGDIWGGGFESGLVRYNRKEDAFEPVPLPFQDSDIIHITPVHRDTILVHTWSSGIYALNTVDYGVSLRPIGGKALVRSRNSYTDTSGTLWIASDEGLYRIRDGKTTYYNEQLSNARVFSIAEDPFKNIWVGTAKGLNKIDAKSGTVSHFMAQSGLPNDFIYGVASDDKGNIWVSTNFGLSEFDRERNTFRNYTEEDGLQNNEFNGRSAYKDSLGLMYFGGMNGFNMFHPDSVKVNRKIGKTLIEQVRLFGKSVVWNAMYSDTLVFSHDQNVITFDYSSLNYLWPERNQYRFYLEGFDKEWRPVTRERSTTYTNLDPGTYVFKVKGSNNELFWGEPDSLTVVIESPWFETLWFKVIAISFLSLCIVLFFLYKNQQQKRLNARLSRMVDERTAELTEANEALNRSLSVSQQQKENITFLMRELNHRVKNNLQLITSLIDIQNTSIPEISLQEKFKLLQSRIYTVSKVHDILNANSDNKYLQIDRFLTSIAQDLISFSGEKISLKLDLAAVIYPVEKITYVGLILNELITNTVKHAFDKGQLDRKIRISFEDVGERFRLVYSDNGKGFDPGRADETKKMGLSLIYTLARELKGEVTIVNKKGSTLILTIAKNPDKNVKADIDC
ncbi:ligand-binding sensor domain-containing protein [Sinomicrobium sp.]